MGLDKQISDALRANFPNAQIKVENQSHLHAGHAGDDGSGESHWHVTVQDASLKPLTRVARHRAIHSALGPQIIGRIHALAIDAG